MKCDYLIVGCGLAGISFAELLLQRKHTFTVIDNLSQPSSRIAAGLYNPVILKRFTEAWNASRHLEYSLPFFAQLERRLNTNLDHSIPIFRKFYSVEEQNDWFVAADKPSLSPYLSSKLIHTHFKGVDAPFGFGEVLQTGYLDTAKLVETFQRYLLTNRLLLHKTFDYNDLHFVDDAVVYDNIAYNRVVFAEGYGLKSNPFFNYLPLDGTKGEVLTIIAKDLNLNAVINGGVFILPLGNHLFKVGATYNWADKSNNPTNTGKKELIAKLEEIITVPYQILEHLAGVRPTVNDRKPLLGIHPVYNQLSVLNGMGTRGVLLAPVMAKQLYDHLEHGDSLDPLVDITRYKCK